MSVQSVSNLIVPPTGLRATGGNIVGTLVSAQNVTVSTGGSVSTSSVTGTFTKVAARSTFVINGFISVLNSSGNSDADFTSTLLLNGVNVGSNPFHVTTASGSTRLNIPVCFTVFPSTITPATNVPIAIQTTSGCALINAILTIVEYQA